MEKFSNAIFFRQIALQNLQRKNLGFSETEVGCAVQARDVISTCEGVWYKPVTGLQISLQISHILSTCEGFSDPYLRCTPSVILVISMCRKQPMIGLAM